MEAYWFRKFHMLLAANCCICTGQRSNLNLQQRLSWVASWQFELKGVGSGVVSLNIQHQLAALVLHLLPTFVNRLV